MSGTGLRQTFYEAHGGKAASIWIADLDLFVFADGAAMEQSSYGALYEPPADRRERLKMQENYRSELLRRATEAFDELKWNLKRRAQDAMAGKPADIPTEGEIKQLQELQTKVQQCQTDLAKVREQYDTRSEEQKQEAAKLEAWAAQHNAAVLKAVEAIKI